MLTLLQSSPRGAMKTQNVNTPSSVLGSVGRRDHSPQPRSPFAAIDLGTGSTVATSESLQSQSVGSAASCGIGAPAPAATGGHNHFHPTATRTHADASSPSPIYLAGASPVGSPKQAAPPLSPLSTLHDKVFHVLRESGFSQQRTRDLLGLQHHVAAPPKSHETAVAALSKFVDDLSGQDARRLSSALLGCVLDVLAMGASSPTILTAAVSPPPGPGIPAAGVENRHGSPRDAKAALMRPSFVMDPPSWPAAASTESDAQPRSGLQPPQPTPHSVSASPHPLPPHNSFFQVVQKVEKESRSASPCAFVGSKLATAGSGASVDGASVQFKPKARRESQGSLSSMISASPQGPIRNTTSCERSVDQDGFKTINDYSVLRHLGKGTSGKVKLVVHHETGELRAIKIVKRSLVKKIQGPNGLNRLRKEVAIMKKLNHRNIIKLHEVIDDPGSDKMYFVLQYVELGEVLPGVENLALNGKGSVEPLSESLVSKYIRQAASGLIYLHNHGIVHFDIKPQNILCTAEGNIVLADFGVSELMSSHDSNLVPCSGLGSPAFMAPEVSRGEPLVDGEAADVWSLGVTAFVLLFGRLPFTGATLALLFQAVQSGCVEYPPQTTEIQQDFFQSIFQCNPAKRKTLRELREHAFLRPLDASVVASSQPLGTCRSSSSILGSGSADEAGVEQDDDAAGPHVPLARTVSFAVTQADVDHALSALVTPVLGDLDVISSCSTASSQESVFSRIPSPRTVHPNPPPPPPGTAATHNPRGDMSASSRSTKSLPHSAVQSATHVFQSDTPPNPSIQEFVSPPVSAHSSLGSTGFSRGITASNAQPRDGSLDPPKVRRETRIMPHPREEDSRSPAVARYGHRSPKKSVLEVL